MHIHFIIHLFCSQFQWIGLAPVIAIVTSDVSRQAAISLCCQWCWDKLKINCTCCCIIISFINDTETEFIWRTLLNMSQGTANPKQPLQNDLCILGRLRLDYTVRVVWSVSSLKKPWVLGLRTAADRDSGGKTAQRCRLMGLHIVCLCWPVARALQPAL